MREALRLGSSTSGLGKCLPEAILKPNPVSTMPEQDADELRKLAASLAKLICRSELKSFEYFVSLPMLELELDHPLVLMLQALSSECEIWSVHAPFAGVDLASPDDDMRRQSIENVKRAANLAGELGARVLTVHPALELPDMEPRLARIRNSGRSIAEVAAICADMGITVAVEILPRKCIGNRLEELFAILDFAGRPNVGICLDANHSFPASALPDVTRRIGSKLVTLHISDHDDTDEKHWMPMRGVIDWPAFVRALKEIHYTGPFLYETSLGDSEFGVALSGLEENYRQVMASA